MNSNSSFILILYIYYLFDWYNPSVAFDLLSVCDTPIKVMTPNVRYKVKLLIFTRCYCLHAHEIPIIDAILMQCIPLTDSDLIIEC